MAVFNGNRAFSSKKQKSQPVTKIPKNVRQAFQVEKAYENGIFKIEPKTKMAVFDRCFLFEDINYINKNTGEKKAFLMELMLWLNSMDVEFKITLANEYQSMDDFLQSIRTEKNKDTYPEIAKGIRQWQEDRLGETNPSVTTLRYLTITTRADNEMNARVYLNAMESTIIEAFEGWGSRIERLSAKERLRSLQTLTMPGRLEEQEYINVPNDNQKNRRDWKNDILPRSIKQYKNFLIMGDTYVTVLFGGRYRKTVNSDSFIRSLTNVSYPSIITMDFAPVETETVKDKLIATQMNNERAITEEIDQKRKAGIPATSPSYPREKKKQEIEDYIDQLDENDEKGFFMNLLVIVTAKDEDTLARRMHEMQAIGKKEGVILETCDFTQLKAWNTALPIGGRQVDYMRFFLTSSLVAFQPYYAQDIIEPGGQMLGLNRTTKHFIIGNRKKLPNPHGIIVGYSGTGKSMLIKLTELSQTLLATDDDIMIIDPQNEFMEICAIYNGSYFDLTPKSGIYLNGFEVSQEVFDSPLAVQKEFIAAQTEYAKTLCAAAMKNINVTQEHDSIISRCTERMFEQVFAQKKLKKQPTLTWLRDEINLELKHVANVHDEELVRIIYNCLEEYTTGSCDMLAHPSNVRIDNRLVGFGMSNVPENNWEAVMVTILHYLSVRMDYNKRFQRATHLVIDETQVISQKPGSARQLNNAVITFRKFGGIVTMAMQNVTAALSNQMLTELYSNCSYKCFLDQGGVDAQSIAAIQQFSAKEFDALSSADRGLGVMVWNKKVVMFDSLIEENNVLYDLYSTDFHEKAKAEEELGGQEENVPGFGTMQESVLESEQGAVGQTDRQSHRMKDLLPEYPVGETRKDSDGSYNPALPDSDKQLILQIAGMTDISIEDVMQLTGKDSRICTAYLKAMQEEHLLEEPDGTGKFRKAV